MKKPKRPTTILTTYKDSHKLFKKLAADIEIPMIMLHDKISRLSPKVLKEILK